MGCLRHSWSEPALHAITHGGADEFHNLRDDCRQLQSSDAIHGLEYAALRSGCQRRSVSLCATRASRDRRLRGSGGKLSFAATAQHFERQQSRGETL